MQEDHVRAVRPGAASYSLPLVLEEFETTTAAPITVMVGSHRKALRATWRSMLSRATGIEVTGEPDIDPIGLASCVAHHLPNVLLLDKAMLDRLDPMSLRGIRAQSPRVRVLLLSDEICRDLVADVLRNRFHGFLTATCRPEVCLKAIRAVNQGELWLSRASLAFAIADLLQLPAPGDAEALRADASDSLTPREMQVVALLRRGCINKEIAQELGIKEDTVKKHLQSVFAKLGVHRRALVALHWLPG